MNNPSNAPYPKLIYPKHDAHVGIACVPCESVNSCCLFCGEIVDASNEEGKPPRIISWPYDPDYDPGFGIYPSKRLFVLAKEAKEGNTLIAKVHIKRTGDDCRDARENRISYLITDEHDSRYDAERVISNQQVQVQAEPFLFSLAQGTSFANDRATGWNTKPLLAVFAIGYSIFDLNRRLSAPPTLLVTPQLCVNHSPSNVPFEVIAIPQFKLKGSMDWVARVTLNSTSPHFTREFEDGVGMNLEYGNQEIVLESTRKQQGENKNQPSKGVLSRLETMINYISTLHERQEEAKQELIKSGEGLGLNNTIGSRITISTKAHVSADVELKAEDGTPNLELVIATLLLEFKFGIIGTLDVIQIASQALTPAVAAAIDKARRQAADENKAFNGYIKADLIFGCESEAKIKIETCTHTLYAEPPEDAPRGIEWGDGIAFEGEIKFLAKAELGIHVGAEAWGVKAELGAHGSLHTSWKAEMRIRQHSAPDQRYQYRNVFEGLIAEVNVYAKLYNERTTAPSEGGRTNTITSENTLEERKKTFFEEIDDNLAEAKATQGAFGQPEVEIAQLTTAEARHALDQMAGPFRLNRQYHQRKDYLRRLEIGAQRNPDNEAIMQAQKKLLEEISRDYHHYRQREELGLAELMEPWVGEWTPFEFFGAPDETET